MAELPSGTVTFLFTDIEGSTALWERDREATRVAVDSHLALLDVAIAAHGGNRYEIVGDAVQAPFLAVPQAAAASTAEVHAVPAEDRDGAVELRSRTALHAGGRRREHG